MAAYVFGSVATGHLRRDSDGDVAVLLRRPLPAGRGIQGVLDISNHLVANLKLGLPADNKELFAQMARHKLVPARLSRKPTRMAGFRNLLVHEYLDIDRHRVYAVLRRDLGDFERFIHVSRRP